jgi:hypothetical protein
MTLCPCCSYPLLQQIQGEKLYWFCRHCGQEMPNFELRDRSPLQRVSVVRLEGRKPDSPVIAHSAQALFKRVSSHSAA